ncbi:hypothetical protein [Nonomuraea sp. NPDC049784]|uniref:hypothetical protein n=1 Tax=Nonomuraea sp. NPDC049784 TaxID=3154361 RepID=UPI0033EDE081
MTDLYEDLAPRSRTGPRITAAGVGSIVAWIGGVAGLLALAAVLLARDVAVAGPVGVPARSGQAG